MTQPYDQGDDEPYHVTTAADIIDRYERRVNLARLVVAAVAIGLASLGVALGVRWVLSDVVQPYNDPSAPPPPSTGP